MTDVYKVSVESDERGFELHLVVDEDVLTDEMGRVVLNVQSVAEELYDAVKKNIGPWLAERDEARATMHRADRRRWESEDDECGYDFLDPKHPTYADRMAHAADVARKQAKGE